MKDDTDLFLYDVKVMDPEKHRAYTGSDNRLILSNLEKLCQAGAKIIIRVPLIPGLTDTTENIEAIATFIEKKLHGQVLRTELLPYNKLAASKYGDRTVWTDGGPGPYPLPDLEPQDVAAVDALASVFRAKNLPVYAEVL